MCRKDITEYAWKSISQHCSIPFIIILEFGHWDAPSILCTGSLRTSTTELSQDRHLYVSRVG